MSVTMGTSRYHLVLLLPWPKLPTARPPLTQRIETPLKWEPRQPFLLLSSSFQVFCQSRELVSRAASALVSLSPSCSPLDFISTGTFPERLQTPGTVVFSFWLWLPCPCSRQSQLFPMFHSVPESAWTKRAPSSFSCSRLHSFNVAHTEKCNGCFNLGRL